MSFIIPNIFSRLQATQLNTLLGVVVVVFLGARNPKDLKQCPSHEVNFLAPARTSTSSLSVPFRDAISFLFGIIEKHNRYKINVMS